MGAAREAGGAAISPDGEHLAYSAARRGSSHLVIADRDGGNERIVAHTKGSDGRPTWSPDGETLAFTRRRGQHHAIETVRRDGTGVARLTTGPWDDGPAWSPDGTLIAFGHRERRETELRLMSADGSELRTLARFEAHGPWTAYPTWSPDGRRIAFTGDDGTDTEIQTIGVDGTGLASVTNDHLLEQDAAWAPDGRLAYARASDLYLTVPGDPSSTVRLTDTLAHESRPTWTPDGAAILFAAVPSAPDTSRTTKRRSPVYGYSIDLPISWSGIRATRELERGAPPQTGPPVTDVMAPRPDRRVSEMKLPALVIGAQELPAGTTLEQWTTTLTDIVATMKHCPAPATQEPIEIGEEPAILLRYPGCPQARASTTRGSPPCTASADSTWCGSTGPNEKLRTAAASTGSSRVSSSSELHPLDSAELPALRCPAAWTRIRPQCKQEPAPRGMRPRAAKPVRNFHELPGAGR